jgi:hypothetical protein
MLSKAATVFVITAVVWGLAGSTSGAVASKGYSVSHFAISIDGGSAGFLKSFSGGEARAEVVSERLGTGDIAKKHLANVSYTPIVVQSPVSAAGPLIERAFAAGDKRFSGDLLTADLNYKVVSKRSFQDAFVTEFSLGELDGREGKSAALVTVKIQPESTKRTQGGGETLGGPTGSKQKNALASNFRLSLGKLPTTRVIRVAPITVSRSVVPAASGELRRVEKQPTQMNHGDLVIDVSATDAREYYEYLESFVVRGEATDDKEMTARLELLDATMQQVLFAMEAKGVGIYHIEEFAGEGDTMSYIRCRFYVEQWMPVLEGGSKAEAPQPAKTPSNTAGTPDAPTVVKPSPRQPGVLTPLNPDLKKPGVR